MQSVGKGTVEHRGGNSWRLRISVTYSDGQQKRLSKNASCRNKTEAKKELDRWRTELFSSKAEIRRDGLTLGEYLDEYLVYCRDEKTLSPTTISGYRSIINNYKRDALSRMKLTELKPYMIEEYNSRLRKAGGGKGHPLSGATVRKSYGFLDAALKRAALLEYIQHNPCAKAKSPAMSKSKGSALCEDEVLRMSNLLRGHPDHRFASAVRLALATGMRRGEVCGLRWQDIDFGVGQICIANSLVEVSMIDSKNGESLELKDAKTDASERRVAVDKETLEWLKRHKEEQQYQLAYYDGKQSSETPVMAGKFGEWYRPCTLTKDFEAFKQDHQFDIRFHDLRHTHASLLIKSGVSIVTVSKRLGHAKVSITMDVYSHLLPGQDEGAAEVFGNILSRQVVCDDTALRSESDASICSARYVGVA